MAREMVVGAARVAAPPRDAALEQRFADLLAVHRDRALRLAWRLVGGDDAAAEDVTQDAFARAWRGLARFRGEASLDTWLYRIVVRQAANHRRWRALRECSKVLGKPEGTVKSHLHRALTKLRQELDDLRDGAEGGDHVAAS